MKDDLANFLVNFENSTRSLSESDNKILVSIFQNMTSLISYEYSSNEKKSKCLIEINKYLKSKLKKIDKTFPESDSPSFLELSKIYINDRNLSKSRIRTLFNKFWWLLELNASKWDKYELSNLLAYCLNTDPKKVIPKGARSQIKIIRVFKAIFNSQDDDTKFETFRELFMRFSTESAFKEALEKERNTLK